MTPWSVLLLRRTAWKEEPAAIAHAIARRLPSAEVFIPASVQLVGSKRLTHWLMPGYVLVRAGEIRGFDAPFVSAFLPRAVTDADVERMRAQLAAARPKVGDAVVITTGPYRALAGRVTQASEEFVAVELALRSRRTQVTLDAAGVALESAWNEGAFDDHEEQDASSRSLPFDPAVLDRVGSHSERVAIEQAGEEIELGDYSLIEPLLRFLPPLEADVIELHYGRKKTQTDIGIIFGMSWPAVGYRLRRAVERIRFILSVPAMKEADMRRELAALFEDSDDVEIFVGLWETTCIAEIARRMGWREQRVGYRFARGLRLLREAVARGEEKFTGYLQLFSAIDAQPNILREMPTHEHVRLGPGLAKVVPSESDEAAA